MRLIALPLPFEPFPRAEATEPEFRRETSSIWTITNFCFPMALVFGIRPGRKRAPMFRRALRALTIPCLALACSPAPSDPATRGGSGSTGNSTGGKGGGSGAIGGTGGVGGKTSSGGVGGLGAAAGNGGSPTGTGSTGGAGGASGGTGSTSAGGLGGLGAGGTGGVSVAGTGGAAAGPAQSHAFVSSAALAALPTESANWKKAYFKACPDGKLAGIWNGGGVVSEGIGYGMLITANAGTQEDFDAVNAFYEKGSKSEKGLLNWTCTFDAAACSVVCTGNGATDADLDIAAALLQAGQRWGGSYSAKALTLIKALRNSVVETCGSIRAIRPGDKWGGCTEGKGGLINPSYYAPAYYRAFAKVDTEGAATWNQLVEDTYPLWTLGWKGHPNKTFLWPDAQKWNGTAFENGEGFAGNGYDACRVPWRIATDYAWSGEPRAQVLLTQISQEIDGSSLTTNSQGGAAYPANSAFIGSLSLAGIAVSQAKADTYFAAWMAAKKDDDPYFQGTLRMLYLLVAAGKFVSP